MPSTLRVELQLRMVSDDDTVIRDEVILQLDKSDDRLEAVGLCPVPKGALLVASQRLCRAPGCRGQIGSSHDRPLRVTTMPHKVTSLPRQSPGIYE
jgi:hypothetical protein